MLVVKLGGSAGIDPGPTLDDLADLVKTERVVFIHGANAVLDDMLRRLGMTPRLVQSKSGQVSRFTDRETMDVMLAVYAGLVNKRLVEGLQARGVNAVGISALDGGIARGPRKETLRAVEDGKPKVLRGDYAGSIEEIDTRLLTLLLDNGYLPVLTPPAVSYQGEAINVDGDKLALRLAIALKADALVILSNTAGLLRDLNDPASLVERIDVSDDISVEAAMEAAGGRMKKKVQAGVEAVRAGIGKVVFADARVDGPVRRALAGQGTVLLAGAAVGAEECVGAGLKPAPTGAMIVMRDKELQPPLYAKRDIALVRGEGVWLWDSEGKRYLDLMSNYGVNILGHAHPDVTEAIQRQAATLLNCHQSFANDVRVAFLEKLLSVAPEGLSHAFLSNSGTEAVEAALKFAWIATGRKKIVAAKRGYHGRTIGALAATADKKYRDPFAGVLAEAYHANYGDPEALEEFVDEETAAIVLEPVQGEGGIHVPPSGYLARAREIAHHAGALLIFDEIQTGFRTGAYFACQHEEVAPDLMCLSKGLANGVPVGATLMTADIASKLEGGVHGTTFGGNALAAAAGLATLEALEQEGWLAHSAEVGRYLIDRLRGLAHPKIREVRGKGLMIGVELKTRATPVLRGLQERGVLALMAGSLTIRFLPPLLLTKEQADQAVATLVEALG